MIKIIKMEVCYFWLDNHHSPTINNFILDQYQILSVFFIKIIIFNPHAIDLYLLIIPKWHINLHYIRFHHVLFINWYPVGNLNCQIIYYFKNHSHSPQIQLIQQFIYLFLVLGLLFQWLFHHYKPKLLYYQKHCQKLFT